MIPKLDAKGSTLCQVKGVVYSCVCTLCDKEHNLNPQVKHRGCYIGETARTLSERAEEHKKSLNRFEKKSFMFKHWALVHSDLLSPPEFKFSVIKTPKDPLSRLVQEAVIIEKCASMNSRAEWGGYKIPRLTVQKSDWEARNEVEITENETKNEFLEMLKVKNRAVAYAQLAKNNVNNLDISCRNTLLKPK